MKLFFSTTSPYARLVRIALAEKGVADVQPQLTDPWKDAPELLKANPSARVPTLVLDNGQALTESLLIMLWLERQHPQPTLLGNDAPAVLSTMGIAMGGIDAAAAIIIGRKMTDASFDESPVGLRRRRSMVQALSRLEAEPPSPGASTPDLAVICTVVLVDYVRFRFPSAPWLPRTPKLDALAAQLRARAAFASTLPRDMPPA
ncbi:glutathione S-transferase N-terminal domain-containing protein [Variovorax sp. E3]|uniref:glutathione S-transferase N-terminal domain-containing protein n=1 Tax=Variovorax sp. E3 TaxID=1914993 RepID=UPI0018DD94C1|nr:glutathione S-transferase N-terminal domain-containing protein [Variovorax sp. E3]